MVRGYEPRRWLTAKIAVRWAPVLGYKLMEFILLASGLVARSGRRD